MLKFAERGVKYALIRGSLHTLNNVNERGDIEMERKFLEDLGLEKEVVDKIVAEHGKSIQAEQSKTTQKETELGLVQKQLTEANNTIKSYKDMNIDEIKASVDELTEKNNSLEVELETTRNNATLKENLLKTNAHDVDIVTKLINLDLVKFDGEKVIGLDEQVEALKTSNPYLFKDVQASDDNNDGTGDTRFVSHEPPASNADHKSTMQDTLDSIFSI